MTVPLLYVKYPSLNCSIYQKPLLSSSAITLLFWFIRRSFFPPRRRYTSWGPCATVGDHGFSCFPLPSHKHIYTVQYDKDQWHSSMMRRWLSQKMNGMSVRLL